MAPPLYIDLDFTLSYAVYKDAAQTKVSKFVFRPGAREFLEALSAYGDLRLLTASEDGWAEDALSFRPDLRRFFSRIIQRNDMDLVENQIARVFSLSGISEGEKSEMVGMIQPIAEPGVVFDDQAYGSEIWLLKSVVVGTYAMGKDLWIRVDKFTRSNPDGAGLERALYKFRSRNVRGSRTLGKNSVELGRVAGYNPVTAPF